MKITEKLKMNNDELIANGAITIVAFGDSVTHGSLAGSEMDHETVYHSRLRKKLLEVRDYVPVNVINAGIGGITAAGSVARLERDVLSHRPDLVIVCFGLNDVNGEVAEYADALESIFKGCQNGGAEVIFMTPNMLNTYVAEDTEERWLEYAAITAGYQNSGKMDAFMDRAREVAAKCGVPMCDCYAEWKRLSETRDATLMLANRINHPTREMHELFADMLFKTIIDNEM